MASHEICSICNTRRTPYPAARFCRECNGKPPVPNPAGGLWTRAQYLAGECRHRDYYGQFITEGMRRNVALRIGENRLFESKDKDQSYNDIPLRDWDAAGAGLFASANQGLKTVGDYLTQAGIVCLAKEAARQYVESIKAKIAEVGGDA